jgi:hypothetical protein
MSFYNQVTFKSLIEKYPDAAKDIEECRDDKNLLLNIWEVIFFALGCGITLMVVYLNGGL